MEDTYQTSTSSKRTLFASIESHSKEDLEEAMTLQSISNPLSSIKNEFMRVGSLTSLTNNTCITPSNNHLQIQATLPHNSHKSGELLHNSNGLESHEKTLEDLTHYAQADQPSDIESGLHMGTLNTVETTLTLDSNHYYEGLNPTSIMVYQVPSGNIVPFDSLVPVSFGKPVGEKQDETDEILNSNLSQSVYDHTSQAVSHPLYILPPESSVDGLFLDKTNYSRSDKCGLPDQLQTDFNLSTSNYDSALPQSSMNQFSMSLAYSSSTIDTDSEVALTLASLGNLKNDNVRECEKDIGINLPDKADQRLAEEQSEIIATVEIPEQPLESENINHQSHPTLVLRSRRFKTGFSLSTAGIAREKKKSVRKRKKEKNKDTVKPSEENMDRVFISKPSQMENCTVGATEQHSRSAAFEGQKENLLGQLLKASKHCEPASLIPEGVVDDVIPAVGYRIMDMSNLSDMIRMMHRCSNAGIGGPIVIQEQASLREGAVSQLSIICTGCQEGAVCATSSKDTNYSWDINTRIEQLSREFNIEEENVQRMLEILGIFYRPSTTTVMQISEEQAPEQTPEVKKRKKKKLEKEKNLKCDVCGEMFSGENHLKSHMNIHNNTLHRCPYCQAYFKKTYNLKEHIKRHENHRYECPECHNFYADRSSLYTHLKTVHENRKRLECEVCFKKFWIVSHYKEHCRTHTGEKPFSCDICPKNYTWHSSLKKHMRTHSAESRYKCRLCGKWFRWLLGVRQHLLQQHKLKKSDIEAQVVTAVTETVHERTGERLPFQPTSLQKTDANMYFKDQQMSIDGDVNIALSCNESEQRHGEKNNRQEFHINQKTVESKRLSSNNVQDSDKSCKGSSTDFTATTVKNPDTVTQSNLKHKPMFMTAIIDDS